MRASFSKLFGFTAIFLAAGCGLVLGLEDHDLEASSSPQVLLQDDSGTTVEDSNTPDVIAPPVDAAAVDGGSIEDVPAEIVTLATGQDRPRGLALDDTRVYWADEGRGRIMAIDKAGGTAETLSDASAPVGVVVDVSDGTSTQVTNESGGAVDPGGWTPDGGSILFSTFNASVDQYSAVSVDLSTGQTTQIVPDGSVPTLSPDGAWIAFNSYLKQNIRLMLANGDGASRRTIARLTLEDGFQEWSPDSALLALSASLEADQKGAFREV